METNQVVNQFDVHPQLAWDLLGILRKEWFLGSWRERRLSYPWLTETDPAEKPSESPDGDLVGVMCWCRKAAGRSPGNSAARIQYIEATGRWRWSASRWGKGCTIRGEEGITATLEEAQDAADRVLVALGARLVNDDPDHVRRGYSSSG